MTLIFDSHLDLGWNALSWKRDLCSELHEINQHEADLTDTKFRGHATTCLPEMRRGKVAVCLGTMMGRVPYGELQIHGSTLDFATHQQVYAFACGQQAYYEALEQAGEVQLIRTSVELNSHWQQWTSASEQRRIGVVLAMEGADAIVSPDQAELWFEKGLRCTSIVHYGTSAYAVGTGQDGPITEAGRSLLKQFESTLHDRAPSSGSHHLMVAT